MTTAAAAPNPRADQMRRDPEGYFRQARQRARQEAERASQKERELRERRKKA